MLFVKIRIKNRTGFEYLAPNSIIILLNHYKKYGIMANILRIFHNTYKLKKELQLLSNTFKENVLLMHAIF